MKKRTPLSEKQRKMAEEERTSLKDLPVMSLEELRAQTPRRAIPSMTSSTTS
jgi:hypothetical protein